jgi:hypothetical protein
LAGRRISRQTNTTNSTAGTSGSRRHAAKLAIAKTAAATITIPAATAFGIGPTQHRRRRCVAFESPGNSIRGPHEQAGHHGKASI